MDLLINFLLYLFIPLWIIVCIGMEAFDTDGGFSIDWDKAKVAAIATAMITAFISLLVLLSGLIY